MPAMARAKVPLAGHGDLSSAASLLACVFMPACAPCSGFILRPHLSAMWCFVPREMGTKKQTPWVLSQVVTLWLVFVFPRPADSDLESAVQRPARCENTVNSFFFCIKLMLYVFVLPQVWVTLSQDFPMDFTASLENPCPTQQPDTPP